MPVTLSKRPVRRKVKVSHRESFDADTLMQLYELLQGQRKMVRVHSKTLDEEICFVNPGAGGEEGVPPGCTHYSTRELSFVLSLSPEELKRYHYLKTKLI